MSVTVFERYGVRDPFKRLKRTRVLSQGIGYIVTLQVRQNRVTDRGNGEDPGHEAGCQNAPPPTAPFEHG